MKPRNILYHTERNETKVCYTETKLHINLRLKKIKYKAEHEEKRCTEPNPVSHRAQ